MQHTLYFYDLETSGFNPRSARIMQFGGQRTTINLEPVGEPHNLLLKLTEDVLPEPDAVLITGITPQQTRVDGLSEAEFLKLFYSEIALPGTIFVGYNTVRFDDEFMRFLNYRNFYDAYEWQYKDERGRWDLLDVVRMMRALRPEGLKWPVDSAGKPTNRLQLMTAINGLDHLHAHDAMSDVEATIDLARLIKQHQPKLFNFLLQTRGKKEVAAVVKTGQPFVYTSGKYSSEFQKTTVVQVLADHPNRKDAVLVYDLRHDPTPFLNMSVTELVEAWRWHAEPDAVRLPVKSLQFNRCPAVAPLTVLDAASQKRIVLSPELITKNLSKLQAGNLAAKVLEALKIMDTLQQAKLLTVEQDVDGQLYDSFINDSDKLLMRTVQRTAPKELSSTKLNFKDDRLTKLLPLYKARNFPKSLSIEERAGWEQFCAERLMASTTKRAEKYFLRLDEMAKQKDLTSDQRFLLEELQLYGESILPAPDY